MSVKTGYHLNGSLSSLRYDTSCWNAGLWRCHMIGQHGRSVHEAIPHICGGIGDSHFSPCFYDQLEIIRQSINDCPIISHLP